MSSAPITGSKNQDALWGLLMVLLITGFTVALVMQFFGAAWYWPWLFFGILVGVVARVIATGKDRKVEEEVDRVIDAIATPNEQRESRMPHLTSIPGQYTRKPCSNPEWIRIPFRTDYEINCFSHVVRHRTTRDIIEPGHDPNGKDDAVWLDLGHDNGRIIYVRLDDVVAETLGRGHS